MIAMNRRIPAQDFLLVAFSVAVIVLSKWPETQPRQWVQLRDAGGTLGQYSLPENDPRLAKLRLGLEKWAKAGQETHLAVAQWQAELADFYLSRTETAPPPSSNPIRAVGFRRDSDLSDTDSASQELDTRRVLESQREYWQSFGQKARAEIATVEEIRRSRKALEVPPPIVFGPIEPGRKPARAILFSPIIGVLVALGFAAWTLICPSLRLEGDGGGNADIGLPIAKSDSAREFRVVVPSAWVRIHQPAGVLARWFAMTGLVVFALVSVLV